MRIGILYPLPLFSNNYQTLYFKNFIKKKYDNQHNYYYLNIWDTPTNYITNNCDNLNLQCIGFKEFTEGQNIKISTNFIYKTYLQYKEILNTNTSRLGNLQNNIFQNHQYRQEVEKYLFSIITWIKEYGLQQVWCLDILFLKFLEEITYCRCVNKNKLTFVNGLLKVYFIKDINYHNNTNIFTFKEIQECINCITCKMNEPFLNIVFDNVELNDYFLKLGIHTKYYNFDKTVSFNNLLKLKPNITIPDEFTNKFNKLLTLLLTYQKCNSLMDWYTISNNYKDIFHLPIEFNIVLPCNILNFIPSTQLSGNQTLITANNIINTEVETIVNTSYTKFTLITNNIINNMRLWCHFLKLRLLPEKELPKIIFQLKINLLIPDVKLNYQQLGKYINCSNFLHTEVNDFITQIYLHSSKLFLDKLNDKINIKQLQLQLNEYGNFSFQFESKCDFNPNIELINITDRNLLSSNDIEKHYFTHVDEIISNLKKSFTTSTLKLIPINPLNPLKPDTNLNLQLQSQSQYRKDNLFNNNSMSNNIIDKTERVTDLLILENDDMYYFKEENNNINGNTNGNTNSNTNGNTNSNTNGNIILNDIMDDNFDNNLKINTGKEQILSLQDINNYVNEYPLTDENNLTILVDNVNNVNEELDNKMIFGYQFMVNCRIINSGYCNYVKEMHSTRNKNNLFRFEPDIYIQSHPNLKTNNIYQHYYLKGITDGLIMSRKQILKWYPDVLFFKIKDKIHINYKSNNYLLAEFVKKFIYEKNLKWFLTNGIKLINKNTKTKKFKLVLFLQIGNNEIGNIILDNILKNINITNFCLCINFVNHLIIHSLYTKLVNKIKSNFNNYIITTSIDYGTDITPFLLQYHTINKLSINYDYVLKLHTKSDTEWRDKMINIFLDGNLNKLLCIMDNNLQIGMIGNEEYLIDNTDVFCKDILNNYFKDLQYKFIGGTCFLTRKSIINNVFNLNNNILKKLFLMNYYYDNYMFFNNSIIHAYERIFGCICYQYNLYILGINKYKQVSKCLIYASHIYSKNINDLELIYQYLNFFNKYVNKLIYVYSIDDTINLTNNIFYNKIQLIKNIIIKKVDNIGRDLYKYKYAMEFVNNLNLSKNTKYILTNDSYYLKHYPLDYFYLIDYCQTNKFIGFIDNKEFLYHYQSFLWCFDDEIKNYLISNIKIEGLSINNIIYNNEVKLSNYIINNYKSITYYKNIKSITHCANINFSPILFDLYKIFKYPILKKRALYKLKNETTIQLWKNNNNYKNYSIFLKYLKIKKYIPSNFNYIKYKELNNDLPKDLNEHDCINHYINYGIIERRLYDNINN